MKPATLVITTEPPVPTPPPETVYVLRLDEKRARFLFSLVSRVQVLNEAGNDSFEIYKALSVSLATKGLDIKLTDDEYLELKYADED